MEKRNNSRGLLSRIMGNIFASWTLVAAAAAAAVAVVLTLVHLNRDTTISIGSDNRIDPTPTLIASMKNIGEWEFLSISDEEMIDTVRHGFFSDDELVRIYYGTLRLGIDMSQADADWIAHSGDSVTVTLPPVKLLDTRFIDEARTKSFFESGKWSNDDRAELYTRAQHAMMKRCLTPANYRSAEQNATSQMQSLMLQLGFKKVAVKVGKRK